MNKKGEDYWSEGGQTFFCCGRAYGVSPDLRSFDMGSEEEILDCLKNNKSTGNTTIDNILVMEINNRGVSSAPRRIRMRRRRT